MMNSKQTFNTIAALSILFTSHCLAQTAKISPNLLSSNVTPTIKQQILGDLNLANSIKLSKTSILHQKVFGKPANSNGYLNWFNKRIKKISLGRCMLEDAAVACVIPILESNMMRITQRYVEMNAPQVARMSVVFHEAKHTEHNPRLNEGDPDLRFWLHVKCPNVFLDESGNPRTSIWTGLPLAGVEGCDSTAIGAYGTVVIMLKNIAQHSTNTSEKVKADAMIYANDQMARISDPAAYESLINDLKP